MRLLCGILAGIMLHGGIYLRPATITETCGELYTAVSHNGSAWAFMADPGDYDCGNAVILVMDDCGTHDVTDDRILEVF